MKGVILAGGLGTRLYPLTNVTNKHLLPVYNKPMIHYPIETLVKAGIKDILIVTSGPHVGHFLGILKNGHDFGLKHIEYAYQEKPDGGIADALSLAEGFADNDSVTVMLGDNTTDADISNTVSKFKDGAHIFVKEVENAKNFGVVEFDPEDKSEIKRIVEKPKEPPTNFAVTGLYIYDNRLFSHIKKITPSARNELEITDVNNSYLNIKKLKWSILEGFWTDAGSFENLYAANKYWFQKNKQISQKS